MNKPTNTFASAMTEADLISAATVALVAGTFSKLGEYIVKAGELLTIGQGYHDGQQDATGRVYAKLADNSTSPGVELKGLVRLNFYDANDNFIRTLGEWRTEILDQSSTDRTKQVPLPAQKYYISRDKKLVLEFKPDASGTLGKSNCSIVLSVTKAYM